MSGPTLFSVELARWLMRAVRWLAPLLVGVGLAVAGWMAGLMALVSAAALAVAVLVIGADLAADTEV